MPTEKRNVLTGGLILITLGVLIFLGRTTDYGFDQTWPILLIVIGISTLIYSIRAVEGWFIATVGVIFLLIQFYGFRDFSNYLFPVVLVLLGIYVLLKRRPKK